MADDVTLRLFGRFQAMVNGSPVPDEAWHGHRAKAVVKLLALAPNHQLHREQLRESLWPALSATAASANLRKAVHYARRALPSTLRVRDAVLSLEGTHLWVDVDAFQAAVTVGDVRAVIDLYTDDLLVEDRYEPWTEEFRTHLRERFRGVVQRTADRLLEEHDVLRAAELFDRLLRVDPLDQAAAAGLARSAQPGGARPGASLPSAPVAPGARPNAGASSGTSGRSVPSERKLVTVVIVDAVPTLGEEDPEVVARDLERWTSLATEVFQSWDGTCDGLLPGTVAAVFGMPRLHEDDAARALQACLDLLARSPLGMRVGVATGEAVVPVDPAASVRGVSGEVMGVADRLREGSAVGRATISERTCRLVMRFRLGAPVRFGGSGLPEIWGRTLLSRVVDWAREGARVEGPMVGRDSELGQVVGAFEAAVRAGAPRFVTVLGPAGMGKTRLVAEAVAAIGRLDPDATVLQGRCLPAGRGGAYSALGEILCRACGISLTDPVAAVQARLRQELRALFGKDELSEATLAAMAAAIGVTMPGAALDGVELRAVGDELSRAWPRFVAAVAGSGPAVVVVEDLHWAGDELLDAMARIAAGTRRPVLFLATARPELLDLHASWVDGLQPAVVLELAPLGERQSSTLLDHLRPADVLPGATRRRLLARAEGNPFFLQELALHAVQGSAPLPDTVSAVLAARLDAVGQEDKLVLQYAAVVGRVFWADAVTRGVGADVTAALDRLAQEGFVVRRRGSSLPGHGEYAFRHALTHEVTYAFLPRTLRARAHADVAEWLEEAVGPGRNDLAELLAFHWGVAAEEASLPAWPEQADRERVRTNAVRWLIRAGTLARARFATGRALHWHAQAHALATTSAEKVATLEALGRDHEAGFHGDAAVRHYRAALSVARADPGLGQDHARLCRRIAWLMATSPGAFSVSPDPHVVEELIAEGLRLGGNEIDRAWLLLVHGISARLWQGSEPFGQGTQPDPLPVESRVRDAETALRVGRARAQPDLVRAAERALKILYGLAGRYPEATALAYRHVSALAAALSIPEQADLLREAAVYALVVDADFRRGLALAERCRTLLAGPDPHQLMHATWPVLVALYHLGRWSELEAVGEEHMAAYRALEVGSDCQFVRDGPLIVATTLAHRGELEAAQAISAAVGRSSPDSDAVSPWQARLELARGDAAAARRTALPGAAGGGLTGPQLVLCTLEALETLEDWPAVEDFLPSARAAAAGNALLVPACSRAAAHLAARAGRTADAIEALSGAIAVWDRLGVAFEAALAREGLASLLPPEAAQESLEAAADALQRLPAGPHLLRVQRRLRDLASVRSAMGR